MQLLHRPPRPRRPSLVSRWRIRHGARRASRGGWLPRRHPHSPVLGRWRSRREIRASIRRSRPSRPSAFTRWRTRPQTVEPAPQEIAAAAPEARAVAVPPRTGLFRGRLDRVLAGLAGLLIVGGFGAVALLGGDRTEPTARTFVPEATVPTTLSPSPAITEEPSDPSATRSPRATRSPKATQKPRKTNRPSVVAPPPATNPPPPPQTNPPNPPPTKPPTHTPTSHPTFSPSPQPTTTPPTEPGG